LASGADRREKKGKKENVKGVEDKRIKGERRKV
jgi:hypothetical protein